MPIVVAGQHYRTTEASNAILTEEPAIGRRFSGEGLLQCCMTTSLRTYFHKHELGVGNVSRTIGNVHNVIHQGRGGAILNTTAAKLLEEILSDGQSKL